MEINKEFFVKAAQGIVNLYGGEYGKVEKVFPKIEKFWFEAKGIVKHDTEGYYYIDTRKTAWLLIKGTDNIPDWFSNFRISKKVIPYDGVNPELKVHTGFLEGFKLMRKWFLEKFSSCKKLFILSHSRGVPISCLAALDIEYHGFKRDDIIVVGEGSPMWANAALMRSFQKRIPYHYMFRKGLDIVTFIPFFYKQYKTLFRIGKASYPIWNSRDHHPEDYLAAIKNIPENLI